MSRFDTNFNAQFDRVIAIHCHICRLIYGVVGSQRSFCRSDIMSGQIEQHFRRTFNSRRLLIQKPGLDTNAAPERLRKTMTKPKRLRPVELANVAAHPQPAVLAVGGSAWDKAAIRDLTGKDGSAPKKRRRKSAAWKTMIAVTTKARREKGE